MKTVRLERGYRLKRKHLPALVRIDPMFTLGDLCEALYEGTEVTVDELSDLFGVGLFQYIEECLDRTKIPDTRLHHIRGQWWYDGMRFVVDDTLIGEEEGSFRIMFDAIGEVWEDFRPGGRQWREDLDTSGMNVYSVDGRPLHELRMLPIRIDRSMWVNMESDEESESWHLKVPAPDTTLHQLLHDLFRFFGRHGSIADRNAFFAKFRKGGEDQDDNDLSLD